MIVYGSELYFCIYQVHINKNIKLIEVGLSI